MRFSADYDSEEEEFPVDSASYSGSRPISVLQNYGTDSEDDLEDGFSDISTHRSPKASLEAWVKTHTIPSCKT
jgi:hypothetical protein